MKRSHQTFGRLILLLALLTCPVDLYANYSFPIGEKAVYSIHWGLITCGTTTILCDEVDHEGRTLIRIRIQAKGNWLVSTVYPVDDTVDCFIDPETNRSLRLEKNTSEGGFVCKDILVFDRQNHTAQWDSQSLNISTNYPVKADTCDAVSFLYAFRQFEFMQGQSREFDLAVDAALHGITVTAGELEKKSIGEQGKLTCQKFTITPKRDDLFVRKIPKTIWITADDRKILAKMVVKVPVGNIRIKLEEYHPPSKQNANKND